VRLREVSFHVFPEHDSAHDEDSALDAMPSLRARILEGFASRSSRYRGE